MVFSCCGSSEPLEDKSPLSLLCIKQKLGLVQVFTIDLHIYMYTYTLLVQVKNVAILLSRCYVVSSLSGDA